MRVSAKIGDVELVTVLWNGPDGVGVRFKAAEIEAHQNFAYAGDEVTLWAGGDLREPLRRALKALDEYYERPPAQSPP